MSDPYSTDSSTKRFRSPPYPSLDLAKAIERARALYGKALHHPVPANVLAEAWKYGIKSSGLWATAAALIQFGLLTDKGSGTGRRFTLTDAAIRIIRDADPSSEKRIEAIKRAALLPTIFRELWERFGGVQLSDAVITNFLTLDRSEAGKAPFSDTAARDIIEAYKSTITFAGIVATDDMSPHEEEIEEDEIEGTSFSPEDEPAQQRQSRPGDKRGAVKLVEGERELVAGLLSKEASFRLIVTGLVGVKEIERLIKKLELDKEILADADQDSED